MGIVRNTKIFRKVALGNYDDSEVVPVVFRVWTKEDDAVTALFPTLKEHGGYVQSYMHVGQHGAASYSGVVAASRPAKPAEYAALKRELESIGYKLRVIERRSSGRR